MPSQKIDPRVFMEKAVEIMKDSIHESRDDHKACPSVGAVLVWPNGESETAFRGEYRNGDHAEYTLLERKNGSKQLDGTILFTTLEPCAPGSRKAGKLSCSERIVNARIKEVWMGVQDPDPQVAGKGQIFLESKGVDVHLFDQDLQTEIFKVNESFINQAKERAKSVQDVQVIQAENAFERLFQNLSFEDFSIEALNYYREHADIQDEIESTEFHKRLMQQRVIEQINGAEVPTGLGILLFGKNPRDQFPQAGLTATILSTGGGEETKDFLGPLILIPDELEAWFKVRFPDQIVRNQMVREQISPLPMKVIRESVINALIHRDYEIQGSKCHLTIAEDQICVKSPGKPVMPITVEQMNEYKAPMLNRNPRLAYIFSLCGLAEERGLGMKTFREVSQSLSLPNPTYSLVEPYLCLTIYLSSKAVLKGFTNGEIDHLSMMERDIIEKVSMLDEFTRSEFQIIAQMTYRTAQRQLARFIDLGLIEQIGSGPSTRYRRNRNK